MCSNSSTAKSLYSPPQFPIHSKKTSCANWNAFSSYWFSMTINHSLRSVKRKEKKKSFFLQVKSKEKKRKKISRIELEYKIHYCLLVSWGMKRAIILFYEFLKIAHNVGLLVVVLALFQDKLRKLVLCI